MNMQNFKASVLDCTLREGGYLNNWEFNKEFCIEFINQLSNANVEYIEVGFLKNGNFGENQTLFNQIADINRIVPSNINSKISAMIMVDEFEIDKITQKTADIKLDCIRVAFKKHQADKIDLYIQKIKESGYEVFLNPTYVDEYSDDELIELFKKTNLQQVDYISLVDTNGFLKEKDVVRNLDLMEENYSKKTSFCFHLHNNLYRAFENAKVAIKQSLNNRNLVVDTTILGMGRGVGNLQTELVCSYLNENFEKNYNLKSIIKLLDEKIYPYFLQKPWGNPSKYFLAELEKNGNH